MAYFREPGPPQAKLKGGPGYMARDPGGGGGGGGGGVSHSDLLLFCCCCCCCCFGSLVLARSQKKENTR